MCHHVHVTLSVEDKVAAKKLAGFLIPVYASIVLAVIAVVAVTAGGPRSGELVASTSAPAVQR